MLVEMVRLLQNQISVNGDENSHIIVAQVPIDAMGTAESET